MKAAPTGTLQLWPGLHISQRVGLAEPQEFWRAHSKGLGNGLSEPSNDHTLLNSNYHFSKGVSFYLTFCSVLCKVKSIN